MEPLARCTVEPSKKHEHDVQEIDLTRNERFGEIIYRQLLGEGMNSPILHILKTAPIEGVIFHTSLYELSKQSFQAEGRIIIIFLT